MRKGLSASLISSIGVGSCCASANLSIPKAGVDGSQLVKNKENFCGESKKARGASADLSVPKAGLDENQVVQNKESFGGKNEKISGGSDTQNKKPWWRFGFIPDWFKAAWWEASAVANIVFLSLVCYYWSDILVVLSR